MHFIDLINSKPIFTALSTYFDQTSKELLSFLRYSKRGPWNLKESASLTSFYRELLNCLLFRSFNFIWAGSWIFLYELIDTVSLIFLIFLYDKNQINYNVVPSPEDFLSGINKENFWHFSSKEKLSLITIFQCGVELSLNN